jgi:chemotaxis signal transduction protein
MTSTRAAQLRAEFDATFAAARVHRDDTRQGFLAVRLGAHAHALRMSEIAGIFSKKKVTPVPSDARAFLGIAAVRGSAFVPVFDLRALLGGGPAGAAPWLVVAHDLNVAYAFEHLDGHLRSDDAPIAANTPAQHITQLLPQREGALPIVDLTSVTSSLEGYERHVR